MSQRIIDFHCDVLYKMLYEGKLDFMSKDALDITLPRMQAGQVSMQVFAVFLEEALISGQPQFSQILRCIDLLRERICSLPDVSLIRWREDVEHWERSPQLTGALLSIEGADGLEGDMVYVRTAYELGVRFLGLTWNHSNWAVDGTMEPRQAGFTNKGRQLIRECDKLGILVDVSHLNERAFWELLELTERPVFASHSNSAHVRKHPRNLSDEQIKAIIDRNGRIGITFVPAFIADSQQVTIEHLLRHIDRICELGGEQHIMFGSDFDGIDDKVQGLEHAGQYGNLLEAIERRYSSEFVNRIAHSNALQFLKTNLPAREG